jgi:MerR family transcriptional regulator/heat shock protein HspR
MDKYREPVYSIGITAKLLKVCQATIRIWEKKGLIKPARIGKNRFYSRCDIERLEDIKELLQEKRINIQGVKTILNTIHCWEIKNCSLENKKECPVYLEYTKSDKFDESYQI